MKYKVPVRIVPLVLSGLLGFSFGNAKKNNNINKESEFNDDKSCILEIPDEKVRTNLPFILNNDEQDLELLLTNSTDNAIKKLTEDQTIKLRRQIVRM